MSHAFFLIVFIICLPSGNAPPGVTTVFSPCFVEVFSLNPIPYSRTRLIKCNSQSTWSVSSNLSATALATKAVSEVMYLALLSMSMLNLVVNMSLILEALTSAEWLSLFLINAQDRWKISNSWVINRIATPKALSHAGVVHISWLMERNGKYPMHFSHRFYYLLAFR